MGYNSTVLEELKEKVCLANLALARERLAVLTERVDELSKRIQTIEGEMR